MKLFIILIKIDTHIFDADHCEKKSQKWYQLKGKYAVNIFHSSSTNFEFLSPTVLIHILNQIFCGKQQFLLLWYFRFCERVSRRKFKSQVGLEVLVQPGSYQVSGCDLSQRWSTKEQGNMLLRSLVLRLEPIDL